MYNKSIGYIIEKMRGDSLTPLGSTKSDRDKFLLDLLKLYGKDGVDKFFWELEKHLSTHDNTFLLKKWKYGSAKRSLEYSFSESVLLSVWVADYDDVFVGFKIDWDEGYSIIHLFTPDKPSTKAQKVEAVGECVNYAKNRFGLTLKTNVDNKMFWR